MPIKPISVFSMLNTPTARMNKQQIFVFHNYTPSLQTSPPCGEDSSATHFKFSPSTHGDELLNWLGKPLEELHIAGSYTLLYNASLMVREGLGCVLAFENIINTKGSDICCRPLKPEIFAQPFIAWKKNQVFSKASQKFLEALKNRFL